MPKDFTLNPSFKASLPRTGHNLSHDFGFTATVAHLLPVFHDILNPGETISVSWNYDIRTMPLQQAAMTKLKVHTEYFFVPMQLLFEPFGSLYYGINDQFSSLFRTNLPNRFPLFDWNAFNANLSQIYNNSSYLGEAYGRLWYRFLDMLGLNPEIIHSSSSGAGYQPNIFPYQLLAYNCIYQYYYRLDERERFRQDLFNIDKEYNNTLMQETTINNLIVNGGLQYRPLEDDYFTNVHISPIVGNRNLRDTSGTLEVVNNWLSRNNLLTNNTPVLSSGSVGSQLSSALISPFDADNSEISSAVQTQFGFNRVNVGVSVGNGVDIGTANIRAMFANEKLWSITGRARKHYDDQTLAHFGFEVPHDVKHEISNFGHDITEIGIGEVISTASTDGAPLGEIAGKGYGASNNSTHKFTAPCHGVVMVIMSIVPKRSYRDTYLKVNALTSPNDLYKPEYDHLGQQPLFSYEVNPTYGVDGAASIFGWQYRYEQYKRRYNRVSKAFTAGASLNSWMTSYNDYYRWQLNDVDALTEDTGRYYCFLPTDINNIMLPQYQTGMSEDEFNNPYLIYSNDPFVVDGRLTCNKVSTMSDYSLPRLDA